MDGIEIDPPSEKIRWGSIYRGVVRAIHPSAETAQVELANGLTATLHNKDVINDKVDKSEGISKRLSTGQFIIVQAKESLIARDSKMHKNPLEHKTPRLSMNIALQGRYLIYMPHASENRVSQRIQTPALRKKMQAMLDDLKVPKGMILRASAANTQTLILEKEAHVLKILWNSVEKLSKGMQPAILFEGPNAIQRLLSDMAAESIDRIEVVTLDHLNAVQNWCDQFAPDLPPRVIPVEIPEAVDDLKLFEFRDILKQIEALFNPYVVLDGGGNIIIQHTAALTAVDVNRGGDRSSNLALNIRAAEEVARQLRLRNVGGIVLVDFLKMKSKKDNDELTRQMKKFFNDDPCTVQHHGLTNLGLYELTRQKRNPSLHDRMKSISYS